MKEAEWENHLREGLKKEAENVCASEFLKTRIDMEITARQEETSMKKNHFKKYIAVAAAVCLLVPAGIFAGSRVSYYMTSSSPEQASKSWESLKKMEKKAKIQSDALKEFSNGYVFEECNIMTTDALDNDGNKMFTMNEVDVTYTDEKGNRIECNMHKSDERIKEERPALQTAQYGETTVFLYEDTYKFVPVGYEPTPEEIRMEEEGNFYISYGSSEIEISKVTSVNWEKDGVSYLLQGFDVDMDAGAMMDMAGEMIESGGAKK